MKILILDDSPFMRGIIKLALETGGYEAVDVEPTSLSDVLQALHREKPDLVLTDLEMPNCHGETVVQGIREDPELKDTPIMMLTAHRSEDLVARLSPWKVAGFLTKPLTPQSILEGVQAVFPLP
jgi:CheY-like chemotaxis protein